jgi:Icc-related predicted phosphoesterase
MKIALGSDLHLEFGDIEIPNDLGADVLILSGDIMVAHSLHDWPIDRPSEGGRNQGQAVRFRGFLKRVSTDYTSVVIVAGNHEFYHGRFPEAYDWLREEAARYPNVHFLQNSSVVIDGITFLGATLWTNMNKQDPTTLHLIENMMNDFRLVKRGAQHNYRRFSPQDAVQEHLKTLAYFKEALAAPGKYVVVTHHAPTALSIHPQYKDDTIMNGGYHSDLSEFILDHPQIALWTHGHVHNPVTYNVGNTIVACNPRGYIGHDPNANNFQLQLIEI